MSVKRRDKKNRVLRNGESQRADGRYVYKYVDIDGTAKFAYSWKLVETDKLPQGKRDSVSLREQEKEIQNRLEMMMSKSIGRKSMVDCYEEYINNKANIKESTLSQYRFVLVVLKKEKFAYMPIQDITTAKVKKWFVDMSKDGKKYGNLSKIKAQLSAMYKNLIENEMVSKNPFDFQLAKIVKNDSQHREALTADEEKRFLEYIACSRYKSYYDAIYLLLNTGLRLGEFCGLRVSDVNMDKGYIDINHQLSYYDGKPHITSTKTSSGKRRIPITGEVRECLERILLGRKDAAEKYAVDGVRDFLVVNRNGRPLINNDWQTRFKNIVNSYNSQHTDSLPNISPHILRHTYCSKLIANGISVKTAQYLMGHNSAQTTLNIYTHVKYENVENEIFSRDSGN